MKWTENDSSLSLLVVHVKRKECLISLVKVYKFQKIFVKNIIIWEITKCKKFLFTNFWEDLCILWYIFILKLFIFFFLFKLWSLRTLIRAFCINFYLKLWPWLTSIRCGLGVNIWGKTNERQKKSFFNFLLIFFCILIRYGSSTGIYPYKHTHTLEYLPLSYCLLFLKSLAM